MILLAILLTIHVDLSGYDTAMSASASLTAGLTVPALIYVLFIVTVTGALTGYILGTFWPSPVRHTLYDFADLARRLGEGAPTPPPPDSSVVAAAQVVQAVTPLASRAPEFTPSAPTQPIQPAGSLPPEVQPTVARRVTPVAQPAPAKQVTPVATDATPSTPDPVDRLQKLAELRDAGVLTPEEFDAAKQTILGSL